jgi:hypothetical protein
LSGSQTQIDALSFEFNSGTGTTARKVDAAFLRLTLEPSAPKVYWGARIDGDVKLLKSPPESPAGDAPWDEATWNEFEEHTAGKPVSIVHFGQPAPWEQEFDPSPLELTSARGAIPLLSMSSEDIPLGDIAKVGGPYEADLRDWAEQVAEYEKPFFLRWNWEMNGTWFKWGARAEENPDLFKVAWRRFHTIAEEEGATNITWVWCPNTTFEGSTSLADLWPGSGYVDWTCMDGYNSTEGPNDPIWRSFSKVFTSTYNEILGLSGASSLPMMIAETASAETGGSKSKWIAQALGNELPTSFPKIKAVVWFNWNILPEESSTRKEWPIETSASARESFANTIGSPFYASNTFGSLTPLAPIGPLP